MGVLTVLLCIAVSYTLVWVPISLYNSFGTGKWFYHNILRWHKPNDSCEFDGVSYCSTCKYCGKNILQDSQGNWFEIQGE